MVPRADLGPLPSGQRLHQFLNRSRTTIAPLCLFALVLGEGARAEAIPTTRPRTKSGTAASRQAALPRHDLRPDRGNGLALVPSAFDETPLPPDNDRDRDRILRLQAALGDIVHSVTLGRLKVGLRVIEARTGRVFFGRGATALMDPASNQKVLATTTALVRLGGDWRFQTEVYGPAPDSNGVIHGDLFLRGSGDPTLETADLDELASKLVARGITAVQGAVVADSRRIGDDRPVPGGDERLSLMLNRGLVAIRVRPTTIGEPPAVMLAPPPPTDNTGAPIDVTVTNLARTSEGRRGRLAVQVSATDGVLQIGVAGRIAAASPGILFRRRIPQMALATAVFFRAALIRAGVSVRDRATVGTMAPHTDLLAAHASAPLAVLLRKINKDSDNYEAEWLLAAVGAEVLGGAATTEKGATVLRQVIGEFGLNPLSYLPKNGSGLGYGNRITAHAMTDLLRALYLDPRVGPELLQSLSVGGIDGTTRNRFRDTLVAKRVRAKTGTLNGKSCLSGLVGDGDDVVAFSIMVEGFRSQGALIAVRGSQVAAVKTMMRYVRERGGTRVDLPSGFDLAPAGTDYETGGEMESDEETPSETVSATAPAAPAPSVERTAYEPSPSVPRAIPSQPDTPTDAPVSVASDVSVVEEMPSPVDDPQFGIGGVGSLAGGDSAPGLSLFADWGVREAGPAVGVEVGFYGTDFHRLDGPGTGYSEWTRMVGAVGPRYQLRNGRWILDLRAQVAVGWFWVHGHGYAMDTTSRTMALGLGSGIRVSWQRQGLSPWLGLDGMGWPGNHVIEVAGVAETVTIPSLDLLLSMGASFRLW